PPRAPGPAARRGHRQRPRRIGGAVGGRVAPPESRRLMPASTPRATMLADLRFLLSRQDDGRLWEALLDLLVADVEQLLRGYRRKEHVLLQIGTCAHWLRPHQTRWTAAGGFAAPEGYAGGNAWLSRRRLPALDVHATFHTGSDGQGWRPIAG